jgi:transcriptional regulator with XRE-family HTH domain
MTENERLKVLRTQLGLTQRLFSQALEIKQGSYSDVERGKAGVSAVLMKNLIRKFRVNPLWLCEGEGTMFISGDPSTWSTNTHEKEVESIDIKQSSLVNGSPDSESQIHQLERQQQYLENIKGLLDFLNEK